MQTTESVTIERGEPAHVLYTYTLRAPFSVELKMTYLSGASAGKSDYVWSFCQPETADRTTWYMVQAYSDLHHDAAKVSAANEFQRAVGLEDLAILESMPFPQLPLGRTAEAHTKADSGCVTYRTIMREIVSGAQSDVESALTAIAVQV